MVKNFRPLEKCFAIHNNTLYECIFYEKDVCTDLETKEVMSRVKILKNLPKTEFIFRCINSNIRAKKSDYDIEIQQTLTTL